jgi:hypothetical protein
MLGTTMDCKLLKFADMTRMGHLQRVEDANLGLGWIYYGLVDRL